MLVTLVGYAAASNSSAARAAKRGTTTANAHGAGHQGGQLPATVDNVPRGGGLVLSDPPIVLTRTSSGDLHAFSAVCTHQGCDVDKVANGKIDCPCHGSQFDADTGKVVTGPTSSGLRSIPVEVRDGSIYTS
jgi:Rieske Fe-S protein